MHIFLIRHAESITNAGENYEKRIPDHLVSLTENGMKQAEEQGRRLAEYCRAKGVDLTRARIWRSPYLRTRQTSEEFNKSLGISDIREDIIKHTGYFPQNILAAFDEASNDIKSEMTIENIREIKKIVSRGIPIKPDEYYVDDFDDFNYDDSEDE